ncbi:extradiol dioxygenase [Devosia nitrariae]|uniref:Extradiol dioxygenase n=2 Tax=Devosia nitrariae TaxID=2071872 RepID=A0ABQ5W905_9HYPH|nr:extradiol dioxygenase [Devosia nitrariae]
MPMLSVADMARSLVFYRDALGGEQIYQFPPDGEPGFVTLRFGQTELGIGLLSKAPLHGVPQRPASGHRVELCVNVEDADEAVEALKNLGAPVVMAPQNLPWGERSAYVEDPDGNLVMLAAPGR